MKRCAASRSPAMIRAAAAVSPLRAAWTRDVLLASHGDTCWDADDIPCAVVVVACAAAPLLASPPKHSPSANVCEAGRAIRR